MLSKFRVQHYKSLFDVEVDLEPLTVFIGPNGSGKSNICEVLAVASNFLQRLIEDGSSGHQAIPFFAESFKVLSSNQQSIESKFWHGKTDYFDLKFSTLGRRKENSQVSAEGFIHIDYPQEVISLKVDDIQGSCTDQHSTRLKQALVSSNYLESSLSSALRKVSIYDFSPNALASSIQPTSSNPSQPKTSMDRTGQGITYALVDVLHENRQGFDELEQRLTQLVPNIKRIALPRGENQTFLLELVDKYSDHHIPATDISDGTLRILAFLTALYQKDTPSIICFEEPENGVHPWLLHKMMELLKIISTEGITGNPVQILITTHSPVLLNYVEPQQVRAVELDQEGKTQVHALPVDSVRFQKALEAYDGALGELWFTNVFGGNPA